MSRVHVRRRHAVALSAAETCHCAHSPNATLCEAADGSEAAREAAAWLHGARGQPMMACDVLSMHMVSCGVRHVVSHGVQHMDMVSHGGRHMTVCEAADDSEAAREATARLVVSHGVRHTEPALLPGAHGWVGRR